MRISQQALIFCLFLPLVFQDGEASKITLLLIMSCQPSLVPVNALSRPSMVPSACARISDRPLFQSHCGCICKVYYLITFQGSNEYTFVSVSVSLQMGKSIAPHIVIAFVQLYLHVLADGLIFLLALPSLSPNQISSSKP